MNPKDTVKHLFPMNEYQSYVPQDGTKYETSNSIGELLELTEQELIEEMLEK